MNNRLILVFVWSISAILVLLGSRVAAHSNTVGILWSGNQPTGACVSGSVHAQNCSLVEIFFGSWHNAGTPQTGTLSIYRQNLGGGETEVIGPGVTPPAINFQINHSKIATLPNFAKASAGAAWTRPVQNYSNKASAAYAALSTEFVLGGNYFWGGAAGLVGDPDNSTGQPIYTHQSAITRANTALGIGTYRVDYTPNSTVGFDFKPQAVIGALTFTVTAGGSVIVNGGGDPAPLIQGPAGFAGDSASSMNLTVGQTSLHAFTANEAVTWSLTGGADQSLFNIHSTTGVLTFQNGGGCAAPNVQGVDSVYVVRVTATDGAGNTPYQVLTLACPPLLSSSTPGDNAVGVAVGSNIVLNFTESIQAGTGNITLFNSSDTIVEAFDVTTDVTISGATVTLDPAADLTGLMGHYIKVPPSAIINLSGDNYAGINDKTTLNFTTSDVAAPILISSVPTPGAVGVPFANNIILTFDENIQAGTGNFTLFDSADNVVEAFDVTTDVTISGATVTLNPAADFGSLVGYYVQVASSAIDDASGNSYAGISNKTTLSFTAADANAPVLTFSPANGATGVAANSNITVTASEAIRLLDNTALSDTNVDALITLKAANSSGADIPFDATISGSVITIDPSSDFGTLQQVYVAVGATIEDSSDNAITGSNATFTVSQFNTVPVGNAGPDQTVATGALVTLDGSNSSDIDATALTYVWTQLFGTAVTLSDATLAQPTFLAPKLSVDGLDTTLIFSLTVNDGQADSTADTVAITVQPLPQTPKNKFMEDEVEVSQVLIDGAERSLYSSFTVNRRALESVRKQFFSAQDETPEAATFLATRGNNVPFDIDGSIVLSRKALNASGSFFVQNGNSDGTYRQLFSGDFDVQRDGITGSSTATLTARAAWEYKVSDDTVLSYFIGGETGDSIISGTYYGTQTRSAATFGSYAVHQLFGQLYLDGFLSFGTGWNNLEIANDILTLESDYVTQTLALGGALSGLYENTRYELRPELAFSYGKTWIGVVDFTGRAYGQIDTTLTSDIGNESVANLTLRPELILALDASTIADSQSQLSFAPRLFCERQIAKTSISSCGDGVEIGIRSQSEDGLSSLNFRIISDKIYGGNRSSYTLNIDHKF